jgi:protein O-GlcNAc transferase
VGPQRNQIMLKEPVIFLVSSFVAIALASAQTPISRAKEAYAQAASLEAAGNHGAALALLWEASGLAPDDPDIQNRLGEALDRIGALDAAIEAYQRALAVRPEFRKAANNLILTLVKAGRGPDAAARARALVDAAPADPDTHFTLGLAYAEQDVDAALRAFTRALDLAPAHALARYNLALVLKRADRIPEAIAELTRSLAIESRPEAHYTLGVIYWQQGHLDRAAVSLDAAIAADPRYVDAHAALGAVRKAQRDWPGAIRSLRRATALRPELWSAHYTLAQVLQLAGDARAAKASMQEAERIRQRSQLEQEASVWTTTGTRKLEQGHAADAVDHFQRALTIYEPYAPAHYQLGRALRSLGRGEAAAQAFRRAQELNPSLVPPR